MQHLRKCPLTLLFALQDGQRIILLGNSINVQLQLTVVTVMQFYRHKVSESRETGHEKHAIIIMGSLCCNHICFT